MICCKDVIRIKIRQVAQSCSIQLTLRWFCITHVPTNAGIVNPVVEIGALIARYNASRQTVPTSTLARSPNMIFYLVDACQSVGQIPVSVEELQCHGLVATGRKFLRGPRGTGFLYVNSNVVDRLMPHHADHYSMPVSAVPPRHHNNTNEQSLYDSPLQHVVAVQPRDGAKRFEFWESNVALKLGLGCAVDEAMRLGLSTISRTIQTLACTLFDKLGVIAQEEHCHQLRLYYRPECGIVTFWVENVDSAMAKSYLWGGDMLGQGECTIRFEVSVVPATSTPTNSFATGVEDLVRASVSYATSSEEIDLFCARITAMLDDNEAFNKAKTQSDLSRNSAGSQISSS
jgi:cysteine desulfurase / selenocysteine lyase